MSSQEDDHRLWGRDFHTGLCQRSSWGGHCGWGEEKQDWTEGDVGTWCGHNRCLSPHYREFRRWDAPSELSRCGLEAQVFGSLLDWQLDVGKRHDVGQDWGLVTAGLSHLATPSGFPKGNLSHHPQLESSVFSWSQPIRNWCSVLSSCFCFGGCCSLTSPPPTSALHSASHYQPQSHFALIIWFSPRCHHLPLNMILVPTIPKFLKSRTETSTTFYGPHSRIPCPAPEIEQRFSIQNKALVLPAGVIIDLRVKKHRAFW